MTEPCTIHEIARCTICVPPSLASVWRGECIDMMRLCLPDNSIDAIVTDPPYGLGFMGKAWDDLPPGEDWARECLRVLKPGGHLLAFGGTRTWHRLAVAVEDAGFEIRDSIAWLYGSGFPKSLNVANAIEATEKTGGSSQRNLRKLAMGDDYTPHPLAGTEGYGNEGPLTHGGYGAFERHKERENTTGAARKWQGWGTALKPAFEPVVVARKPLIGTVAGNVQAHGTGALNIDATRIAGDMSGTVPSGYATQKNNAGRWPANVMLDEGMAGVLDQQSGTMRDGVAVKRNLPAEGAKQGINVKATTKRGADAGYGGSGGASRFFYVAKAPKNERPNVDGIAHPTVKPLALMRWLVRLVTPPGGTVLDPFAGSGTTLEAATLEGFKSIGIEREADYLPLIAARLERVAHDRAAH